ncbi:MAG: hypothetical protein OER56_13440, partial [Hyphomicrobiales bacterium]|nr:hypothetical protein [Hyphomicrobiales bacterium]
MFSSPQTQQSQGGIPVALKLTSGGVIKGYLTTGVSGKLPDTMNKPEPYVEIMRGDGTVVMIAKAVVAQIEQINVAQNDQLTKRIKIDSILDPYTVLGVSKTSSSNE